MKQEEKMKGALGEWLEKSGKVIEVFRPKPNNHPSDISHLTAQ